MLDEISFGAQFEFISGQLLTLPPGRTGTHPGNLCMQIQAKQYKYNTKCVQIQSVYMQIRAKQRCTVYIAKHVQIHVYANSCQTIQLEQIKHGWAFATLLMMICKYSRGICWPARYMNDV